MTTYGITDSGPVIPTLDDLKKQADDLLKSKLGEYIAEQPESVVGQLRDVFAELASEPWEVLSFLLNSTSPDNASGVYLDILLAINGIIRKGATFSTVATQALIGTVGTTVPAATTFSVENTTAGFQFQTVTGVTLDIGEDAQQTIVFSAPPTSGVWRLTLLNETTTTLDFDISAEDLQTALSVILECSVSGSVSLGFIVDFVGSGSKQPVEVMTEASNTTGETLDITVITTGEYQATTEMIALEQGPKSAPARKLTVIDNSVPGLSYTFNAVDADLGRDVQTDAEAKEQRNESIELFGKQTPDSLEAKLLQIPEVVSARVVENLEDFEVGGIPAHGFEAFVYQVNNGTSADNDIAFVISADKGVGVPFTGDVPVNVTSPVNGQTKIYKFSRPTDIEISATVTITKDPEYPIDGDTQVRESIVAFGVALGAGEDVISFPYLIGSLDEIPGIRSVEILLSAPGKTPGTIIDIDDGSSGEMKISDWDTTRITVI